MKVAVITGGTQGIGLGLVRKFLNAGYRVITCGRKNDFDMNTLQVPTELLNSFNYYRCDISVDKDRTDFIDRIIQDYEKIDVLINNAGVAPQERKDMLEIDEAAFDWLLKINLYGPFFLSQRIANEMIQYRNDEYGSTENQYPYSPCIINITSISAWTASVNRAEYCIAKAGLAMTTQLFAARLAEYNIPVFEIQPGIIETPMTEKVHEKYDALIAAGVFPLRRWGTPEDIAITALSLAEGSIPYSTGQVIKIDGGFHIHRL